MATQDVKVRIRPHNPYYQHSDAEWALHLKRQAAWKLTLDRLGDLFTEFVESYAPTWVVDETVDFKYTIAAMGGTR